MSENITSASIYALVDMTYYAIGCAILSVIGFAGNGLVIFTVAKNSEMREKSHLLVTSLAFVDFFTCLGIFLAAFATFFGYDKNIPQIHCLLIQTIATYWSSVDNMLILLIGIDRVIILRHSFRYTSWPTGKYVGTLIAIALCFGLLIVIMAFANSTSAHVDLCILPSAVNGFAKQVWMTLNAVVCLGVLLVYLVAGMLVRKRRSEHSAATTISSEYRRLLNSLTIVAAVYIFSTLSPVLYFIVFSLIINLDPLTLQQYAIYSAWTFLIQLSCAPFIYYMRSREYRTAFRKILCGNRQAVGTVVFSIGNNAASLEAIRARRLTIPATLLVREHRLSN